MEKKTKVTNEIKKVKKSKENETTEIKVVEEKPKDVKLLIENLTKNFVESNGLAVDNVSFSVFDGEFLSILGPSGCGKTTILRMLIGLIEPTSGKIYKNGKDITSLRISQRGMGIVFQNYALFENMTVLGNVEYALKIKKPKKTEREKTYNPIKLIKFMLEDRKKHNENTREQAMTLLKKMHLEQFADKKPVDLSGGQQQRVAIARTLALHPDIILFDEPMSALDVATRLELCAEIKRVQKEFKTTIIYITHDQEEAFTISDRIMVMSVAKIAQIGTPEEILSHPENDYVKSFVCDNLTNKINTLKNFVEIANGKK